MSDDYESYQICEDLSDINMDIQVTKKENTNTRAPIRQYKLGEVINNGIRYWGQEKQVKYGTKGMKARSIMCICTCGEAWRAKEYPIRNGDTKSCGKCKKE